MNLEGLGWKDFYKESFEEVAGGKDAHIGRIVSVYRNIYKVISLEGELMAKLKGGYEKGVTVKSDYPCVGDFVVMDRSNDKNGEAQILGRTERFSIFSRVEAGKTHNEQVIASNLDYLFVCTSLNEDFNLRRIERYLAGVSNKGFTPILLLTKSDICENVDEMLMLVEKSLPFVRAYALSSITMEGIEIFDEILGEGITVAFVGSSGVGKSTLINAILGREHMVTKEIRNIKGKGKHTTTHRELILHQKGILIDTPGMREFQLAGDGEELFGFDDILELIQTCKFRDCSHVSEPGCAILSGLSDGSLDEGRYNSYLKLQKEMDKGSSKEARLKAMEILRRKRKK